MKIKRLRIVGFGPYKNEQTVDFERFDDDGIFLITGKTGAGKSSILDAVCYALYGSVPRYDGTQPRLRSDYAELGEPTYVELEFSISGSDYRIHRVPEYEKPKSRGEGTTKQLHEAQLDVRAGDRWEGLAARPVDVGHELARILPLNKEQFLQVILLAQNRFQEFLLAKNDARQDVLRTLFGTKRFRDIETELDERRKAAASAVQIAEESLKRHAERAQELVGASPASGDVVSDAAVEPFDQDWLARAGESLEVALAIAVTEAASAEEAFRLADVALTDELEIKAIQLRRDAATATLASLVKETSQINASRETVAAAHRAESVWPLAKVRDAAAETLATAEVTRAKAGLDYLALPLVDDTAEPSAAALEKTISSLHTTVGTLTDTLIDEARLPVLSAEIASNERQIEGVDQSIATATALEVSLPASIQEADDVITARGIVASHAASAAVELARATAARAALKRALGTKLDLDKAAAAEKAASSAKLASAKNVDDLLERRLSGHAAELAAELVESQPCAVCGSLTHPSPAKPGEGAVSEEDLEAARAASDKDDLAYEEARTGVRKFETAYAEELARTDGKSADALDTEFATAEVAVSESERAAKDVTASEKTRTKLRDDLAKARTELTEQRERREKLLTALTAARTSREAVEKRVKASRAEYDSVAERAEALITQAAAAQKLADALTLLDARARALDEATKALEAQSTDQQFETVDAAIAARVPASELAAVDKRIREHDEAIATANATIADTAAADIPTEPVDVEATRAIRTERSAVRDAALAAKSATEKRVADFAKVSHDAKAELEKSARQREDFDVLRQLANVVAGNEPNEKRMKLEAYVLAAQLEEIVDAANLRLTTMTSGRYTLEHDDALQYRGARSGLSLAIRDEHTGRSRATHSLSGGETFLASLALALGLAEVVTSQAGGIRLDTLFVDEGFGSLDAETLEIAMSTLDSLRAGGRTIGLISHVEAMKEQIPAKLQITVTDAGYSLIAESYAIA